MRAVTAKGRPPCAAYRAMAEEASRVRWPEQFATDLCTHDRAFLEGKDGRPFFWVLRRDGTFLCEVTTECIDGAGHFVWHAPQWFPRTFAPDTYRFYLWDGAYLRPLPADPGEASASLRELAFARAEAAKEAAAQ